MVIVLETPTPPPSTMAGPLSRRRAKKAREREEQLHKAQVRAAAAEDELKVLGDVDQVADAFVSNQEARNAEAKAIRDQGIQDALRIMDERKTITYQMIGGLSVMALIGGWLLLRRKKED